MADPTKNGSYYAQNYDIIVKWIAEVLRGNTLEVLGVQTDRIQEVFGFEPVNISVKAGRVDVIARCENGDLYHIEEQRHLSRSDMYRFASQHFSAASQWGSKVTDIILASGRVTESAKTIITSSGSYKPIIIDFTLRDGWLRLKEIREAVASGDLSNLMELIFLPLYGKEESDARTDLAEQVVRFEIELFKQKKVSDKLLAATLIMANKLLSKDRINELWEEIKMLDIIEVAMEKGQEAGYKKGEETGYKKGEETGYKKGRNEGRNEGRLNGFKELLMGLLIAKFNLIPRHIAVQIKKIQEAEVLQSLIHVIIKCEDIKDFEAVLNQV
ncbi:MAG: hypothetical protein HQK66_15455 [Desulfamplus sp.]|nr:hypothetical protein [Desulfamplus sp.]